MYTFFQKCTYKVLRNSSLDFYYHYSSLDFYYHYCCYKQGTWHNSNLSISSCSEQLLTKPHPIYNLVQIWLTQANEKACSPLVHLCSYGTGLVGLDWSYSRDPSRPLDSGAVTYLRSHWRRSEWEEVWLEQHPHCTLHELPHHVLVIRPRNPKKNVYKKTLGWINNYTKVKCVSLCHMLRLGSWKLG